MKITLFFTYGVSLKIWAESGLLQREVYLYLELMRKHNIEVQFLTYGDTSDRQWQSELKGITLLPVYERLPILRYKILSIFQSILIPWYFRKEFQKTNILKTNQVWGSWVAILVKWIFHKPLLIRCDYVIDCSWGSFRGFYEEKDCCFIFYLRSFIENMG